MINKYMTRKEAAEYLGISYRTLCQWAKDKYGPVFIKAGKSTRYEVKELDKFLEKHKIFPLE